MKALCMLLIMLLFSHRALTQSAVAGQNDSISQRIETIDQNDSLDQRIVIIGDAGDPGSVVNGKIVILDAVRRAVPMDKKTTVIYAGDNIYANGLPCVGDVCFVGAIKVLDAQAALVKGTPAKAYFIPGNHDWANSKPEGYDNIIRQGTYVNHIADNIKFYPEDGCPGPVEVPISKDVVMIIMDSQWWLLRHDKPGVESECEYKTEDEVLTGIKDILARNAHKLIIFTCHHPFRSTGVHSGYYGIKQHIFPFTDLYKYLYLPLPVIGSIYPVSRSVFGSPQDLKFPLYANMIAHTENVLKTHPYVLHVAGHEHNLQLIKDSSYYYLISGGGCKSQRATKSKKTKFVSATRGFAVLDISKNKTVRATFYVLDPKTELVRKEFSQNILDFSKFPEARDTVTVHETVYKDSVTAAVNKEYENVSHLRRKLLGNNYRREWATPVKFKVFNINESHGGLAITRLGGGKQTTSLHLKDSSGNTWNLRNLNKNPDRVVPDEVKNSFASSIVQDMVSASYPYGALPVPVLADALGIAHATPEYYFVPDDDKLGIYKPLFANKVCMLERLDPVANGNKNKSKTTNEMFNRLRENNDRKVDQKNFLKARMLDFLIADYDRHKDQWKWGLKKKPERQYYPIPMDRDEAFFYSDGLVMKLLPEKKLFFLKGFQYNIPKIKWEGYVARYLDRDYLNEIDESQWKSTLNEFHDELTDSVFSECVKKLPPEIALLDSNVMIAKLQKRRDLLPEKSLIYYRYLSRRVNILGSNKDEYFQISSCGNGVSLDMYARGGDTDRLMYSRKFDPKITKELRLYGFNGNDFFDIDKNVHSKIKVIMIGGTGNDSFNIRGKMPNAIYDFKKEDNVILARRKTRNMMSNNPLVNVYSEKEENYTVFKYPNLQIGYNPEDGFLIGPGVLLRTYNFRKRPYSSEQKLTSLFAPGNSAFQIRYGGIFNDALGRIDIVPDCEFFKPRLNKFFGFGNDTKKQEGSSLDFYQTRFTDFDGSVLARKRLFNGLLSIGIGPSFYYYENDFDNLSDRIIAHPSLVGLDSASIYRPKSYGGGKLSVNINNVTGGLFNTRGVDWVTTFTSMAGLNNNSSSISTLESNMSVYASLSIPARVVAALHIGGGHIFNNQFEFFQALTLGSNNYLRGFQKDRYSGSSLFYTSVELRVKLIDLKSYVIPSTIGLTGFNDLGRVWMVNQVSHTWHDAYGGGIYFTPFNIVVLSATAALSIEQTFINFTVGARINLIF